MRLLYCHIENFGKLCDVSFDFTQGLNTVCEDNGWGKSTLAAFLRVMLYGFEGEGKKKDPLENERKRYQPWQNGIYGGELSFAAGEKEYSLRRTFGAKASEDVFELRTLPDLLASTDYTSNIGEELFAIDAASFRRTVFLSQNDCAGGTTDSINAKLGRLTDNTDDINNFESADKRLKDLLNHMSPTRSTGTIKSMERSKIELQTALRGAKELKRSMETNTARRGVAEQERETLSEERAMLRARIERLGIAKDQKARREKYCNLTAEVAERKAKDRSARSLLPEELPEAEELTRMRRKAVSVGNSAQLNESLRLNGEESTFLAEVRQLPYPEEETVQEEREKLRTLRRLRTAASEAEYLSKTLAEREETTARRIEELSAQVERASMDRQTQEAELILRREQYAQDRQRNGETKSSVSARTILLALGAVLLISGAVLLVLIPIRAVGISLLAVGAGALVVSFFVPERKEEKAEGEPLSAAEEYLDLLVQRVSMAEDTLRDLQEKQSQAEAELSRIKQDAAAAREEYSARLSESRECVNELESFCTAIGRSFSEEHFEELLGRLSADRNRREELLCKESAYLQKLEKSSAEERELAEYCERFALPLGKDVAEQLLELQEALQAYTIAHGEYERAVKALEDFQAAQGEAGIPEGELIEEEEDVSLEELNAELASIDEALAENFQTLRSYQDQLEQQQSQADELDRVKEELADLTAACEQEKEKYRLLELTKELLGEAKTSFTARYTQPVMSGFAKYYEILTGQQAGRGFEMDANTTLHVVECNGSRDVRTQSAGIQDLIGLCMRMALVDAMYEEEKPFLILDDPFTNLDEGRTAHAKQFLASVASQYQVIYFTCHTART